jgi:hypothetical protein
MCLPLHRLSDLWALDQTHRVTAFKFSKIGDTASEHRALVDISLVGDLPPPSTDNGSASNSARIDKGWRVRGDRLSQRLGTTLRADGASISCGKVRRHCWGAALRLRCIDGDRWKVALRVRAAGIDAEWEQASAA